MSGKGREKNKTSSIFIRDLLELREMKLKEKNLGLSRLPSSENIRKNIMIFLKKNHYINNDMWIWSDTTKEDFFSLKNYTYDGFDKPDEFYELYMNKKSYKKDIGLFYAYENPNNTSIKYSTIKVKEYRKLAIYNEILAPYKFEDSIITNVVNPINGITTFFSSYRTGYEEKYFFGEEDRQRQEFFFNFLSFHFTFPIAICSQDGFVYYRDSNFLDICRLDFPTTLFSSDFPSTLLADLIFWNHFHITGKSYRYVDFITIKYKNIYITQAIPKGKYRAHFFDKFTDGNTLINKENPNTKVDILTQKNNEKIAVLMADKQGHKDTINGLK